MTRFVIAVDGAKLDATFATRHDAEAFIDAVTEAVDEHWPTGKRRRKKKAPAAPPPRSTPKSVA